MSVLNKLAEFVGKYLTYIVFAVVVAAFFFPKGFTWAASQTVLLLSVIMFGMGMTLRASDFALVLSRPKEVFFGCVGQFTIMPFLAYVLTVGFELPPELAIGMILLGTTPGGTASNVMTYLAKGDVTLSVCLTTATTLLAPLLTPFLTWMLAGQWVEVSFLAMLKSVSQVILLPIVLGILVHKAVGDKLVVKYSKLLVLVSAFSVLSIMGAMVALNGETILRLGWVMVLVVVLQNFGGYALGWMLARKAGMGRAQCTTVMLEVGMQNAALACSLGTLHFTPMAAVPGAIGGVVHQITGSLLASIFAARNGKQESAQAVMPEAEPAK